MATEIERKFLVDTDRLGPLADGVRISQGYIPTVGAAVVRARLAGDRAWLTIKGASKGLCRSEFEYPIPPADATQIIDELCGGKVVTKTRFHRECAGYLWEIDVFEGENAGLVVAEVELASEAETPELPAWVREEVTGDPKYYNASLVIHPFRDWA